MHSAPERSWAATFCQDFRATTGEWPAASLQENWNASANLVQRQASAGPSSPPLPRYDSVSSDLGLRAPEMSVKFDSYTAAHTAVCSLSGHSSQLSASTMLEQGGADPVSYLYGQGPDSLDSDIEEMLQLQDLQPSSSAASQGSSHSLPPSSHLPHISHHPPSSEPQPVWQSEERRRRPRSRSAQIANPHLRCSLLSTFNALAAQNQGLSAQRSQHSQASRRNSPSSQQILLHMLAEQRGQSRGGASSLQSGGCTLQQWVARHGPLTPGQCCAVLAAAGGQLRRLHAQGQAHGCLCLQTLLLGRDEDFASLRVEASQEGSSMSQGCPMTYTAPELLGLPASTCARTAPGDMWALGICAFLMLTGSRLPFSAIQLADQAIGTLPDSVQTWLDFHLDVALSQSPQAFPQWTQEVLKGLLRADPGQRITASKLNQLCRMRQEAPLPGPELPEWQFNLSYEEAVPRASLQSSRWPSASEDELGQAVSTLSRLGLHGPRPHSAGSKPAALQSQTSLHRGGLRSRSMSREYPHVSVAQGAVGSASVNPMFCSSSNDPAPQGTGQTLISWLQRLVRPSKTGSTDPHAGQQHQHPQHQWH